MVLLSPGSYLGDIAEPGLASHFPAVLIQQSQASSLTVPAELSDEEVAELFSAWQMQEKWMLEEKEASVCLSLLGLPWQGGWGGVGGGHGAASGQAPPPG